MNNLTRRYSDAYAQASSIDGTGQAIKALGVVLGIALGLGGLVMTSKLGWGIGLGIIFLAVSVAVSAYSLGMLVAAQGQILLATLDTAVNSSPLLTKDEVREIIDRSGRSSSSPSGGGDQVACSECGKLVASQTAVIHANRWFCSEHAPPASKPSPQDSMPI